MNHNHFIGVLFAACSVALPLAAQLPYQDPTLTAHERAVDLCGRLTLEEKAKLMMDSSPAIPRLGIPQFEWWSEVLHGVARNGFATVFPQTIGMAASFDDALVYNVFSAARDEAVAKNNLARQSGSIGRYQGLSFWTPNINIFRDPRWGRGQETYGEDPYLTERMGLAVVSGLQGQQFLPQSVKVLGGNLIAADGNAPAAAPSLSPCGEAYKPLLACAKHFAVHSGPEWNRHSFDVENLPQRDLWETYLPAFKALVQQGGVREVMCAYQRFDGQPCCGSEQLLQQILRQEWGFDGLVVSDCGAISDFWVRGRHETDADKPSAVAHAVGAGTDVECGSNYSALPEAVAQGKLTMDKVDQSVVRLLEARFTLGDFDSDSLVAWKRIGPEVIASDAHRQLALQMARETMTLLQNNHALLPLRRDMKIAVMGPNANDSAMLWANYNGYPLSTTTILKGIQRKAPSVNYIPGAGHTRNEVDQSYFSQFRTPDGGQGMRATYWNNTAFEGAASAVQTLREPINQSNGGNTVFAPGVELEQFSASYEGIFTPTTTETLTAIIEADDMARLIVNGDTLLNNWRARERVNKDRRDYTFEAGKEYQIKVDYVQTTGMALCRFDIVKTAPTTAAALAEAARDADVVVFCGGISPRLEGEEMKVTDPGFKGGDRTSIELPQSQRDVINQLHEMGKRVVLVNLSGSAIALEPESRCCDAILQAWYGGEAGGEAVADVLFGDYNPGGKLPVPFYARDAQLPDVLDYRMAGRTYRYLQAAPLFPFGHGLSYTTFALGKPGYAENLLSVELENTGSVAGDEVVQLYVRNPRDSDGPAKTLRAFRRVHLAPGKRATVSFPISHATLELWDASTNTMRFVPGTYELMVGTSSADEQLQTISVELQ